jgi:hypothetical protein
VQCANPATCALSCDKTTAGAATCADPSIKVCGAAC